MLKVNINGIELKKDRIRNSFVHGTYFNYIPNDKSDMVLFLYDYDRFIPPRPYCSTRRTAALCLQAHHGS